ncbi:MAG TPA: YHS domain-containing protein [Desulfobulbus sp.]|nr:YHS domain-containing protein [Desulfobulbus sp.]
MHTLKTLTIATTLALFLSLSMAGGAFAAPQTTCPVMGGKINKKLYADYKGQRVYFCCLGCPPEFKKNPEKYIQKLKKMGQEPEKIDTDSTKK